jgi:hypothetical protein
MMPLYERDILAIHPDQSRQQRQLQDALLHLYMVAGQMAAQVKFHTNAKVP